MPLCLEVIEKVNDTSLYEMTFKTQPKNTTLLKPHFRALQTSGSFVQCMVLNSQLSGEEVHKFCISLSLPSPYGSTENLPRWRQTSCINSTVHKQLAIKNEWTEAAA